MARKGLFVGMVTLDLVYLTEKLPDHNQKIVASDYMVTAGGPATNAAVTFCYLGNQATLLGVVGAHPITNLIRGDLEKYGVSVADLAPMTTAPPPVSSIIVTETTGDRAVVSINATKIQLSGEQLPTTINDLDVDLIMIDGHQMLVGFALAQIAKEKNIPIVIDGGSWKPGFEKILPLVNYAICSANFYPPGCTCYQEVIEYLAGMGIPHIALTQGEKPIRYLSDGVSGQLPVPQIQATDTMGAGDIFHGAFCHYILKQKFTHALTAAAKIASRSCEFFGTRRWMESD